MASGSFDLTTYYAKRIIGDTNAASAATALLQAGVDDSMWIFGHNRNNYGIRYLYDSSTNGTADKIEFHGGHATNTTAWIQLDTGDASFGIIKNGTWQASIIAPTYGGTGESNLKDAGNAIINALDTGTSVLTAGDYMITQYVGGGTTTTTYYRRQAQYVRVGGLTTGRTLKVALGSTSASTAFDGTANISDIGVSGTLGTGNGGTGNTSFTTTRMIYSESATKLASADHLYVLNNYLISNSRNGQTVDVRANGLIIYGATYGNTVSGDATGACRNLLSNKAGVFRFGDGGPQIIFNTSASFNAQGGALIYTDNDSAATGASFHFVTTESSDDNGGTLTVTAPRFRARTGLTVGQNSDNTSYNLYVNGTTYTNNDITTTGKVYINNTTDVAMAGDSGALVIGNKAGANIGIDGDEIHARNNKAASNLSLNYEGGNIVLGVNNTSYYVNVRSTKASTASTDGALVIGGGVGIGGKLYTGNDIIASGTIHANGGYLKSTLNNNTVTIGSQNTSFCHIYNSASIPFIFNNTVETTSGNLGTTAYPWNNLYIGKSDGAGIYYTNGTTTIQMIRFLVGDSGGHGIQIGGGGAALFGSGESAGTVRTGLSLGGATEQVYITSDNQITFFTNQQNGYNSAATVTIGPGNIWAGVDGDTTYEAQVGAQAGSGRIYIASQAASGGTRGLYAAAHGSATTGKFVVSIDTNNNATFSGNATSSTSTTYLSIRNRLNADANAMNWNPCAEGVFKISAHIMDSTSRNKSAANSPSFDCTVLELPWDWGGYNGQLALTSTSASTPRMQIRSATHIDQGEGVTPRYVPSYSAWREVVTATKATQMGSATKPVYVSNTGQITEGTALGASAYHADSYFALASHGNHVPTLATTTAKKFLKDTGSWVQVDWGDLTGKPTTFAPSSHNHASLLHRTSLTKGTLPSDTYWYNTATVYETGTGTAAGNRLAWIGGYVVKSGDTGAGNNVYEICVYNYVSGGTSANALQVGIKTDGTAFYAVSSPAAFRTAISAAASDHTHSYVPLSGGTMTGDLKGSKTNIIGSTAIANHWYKLYLGGQTVGSNAINSATPLIEFSNVDRSQYCQLIYSDYDSLVSPDSLTLIGNQAGTHFIAPKINAGDYINNSYAMSTASFICESWVRTKGATGWYNEDYGGGWYMPDANYVKLYGNKQVVISSSHATSTTNKSSQLIVSSVAYNGNLDTADASAVAIELWRGGNASWQIINDGGNLHFKNNWTTAKQSTYTQDSVSIAYNSGTLTTITGNLFSGTTTATSEHSVRAISNSGQIYLYSSGNANSNGNRGLYLSAHGSGSAKNAIIVDTNNNVTFYGALSGNASTATSLQCGVTLNDVSGSSYGNVKVTTAKGGYYGFLLGTSTSCINIMSTGVHNGIYCQAKSRWAFYYNSTDDRCSIGGSTTTANYILTVAGSMKVNNDITANKVYNAVWNDYAECRQVETEEPGYCVTETSSGTMIKTNKRLQAGCKITSDTFGTCMGETDTAKTPIAVAGRVLVYPYRARKEYELGAAVCSAPNGTVDIMTRDEIMMYPERIVGTVSEIPIYEIWHGGDNDNDIDIKVNGRIWIYVR